MEILKGRLLFFTIIGFAVLLTTIDFLGDAASNNILNFDYSKIQTLVIEDRGLKGNEEIVIMNSKELEQFTKLLKKSDLVNWNSINWKANQGLCELHFTFNGNKSQTITLTNTSYNGGVITSGNYHYRNDSLLYKVIRNLEIKK